MFFLVSKIFWLLVQPLSLIFLLILVGLLAYGRGWRRTGIGFSIGALLVLGLFAFTTLGALLIAPLEDRFSRPATAPENVGAVIVLGGGFGGVVSGERGIAELRDSGDRFVEALRLAQVYPQAKIIVTGGVGNPFQPSESDAEIARRFYAGFGIPEERLVFEGESRNTAENVEFTKALVDVAPGQSVLLVTSAFHMPRSMGIFRQAGLDVVPWPVDYRAVSNPGFGLELAEPSFNVNTASVAIKEWVGLLVYNLTGRTDALFPAP